MAISIEKLYETSIELPKLLAEKKVFELEKLLAEVQASTCWPLNTKQKDDIITNIRSVIKEKKDDQFQRFNKVSSPVLETYLQDNFPKIRNIHESVVAVDEPNPEVVIVPAWKTAMTFAIRTGRLDIVQALIDLEDGIEPYFKDDNFYSTLIMSAKNAKIAGTCLQAIAPGKRKEVLRIFLKHYLVNAPKLLHAIDKDSEYVVVQHFWQDLFERESISVNPFADETTFKDVGEMLDPELEFLDEQTPTIRCAMRDFYAFYANNILETHLLNMGDGLKRFMVRLYDNLWLALNPHGISENTEKDGARIKFIFSILSRIYHLSPPTLQDNFKVLLMRSDLKNFVNNRRIWNALFWEGGNIEINQNIVLFLIEAWLRDQEDHFAFCNREDWLALSSYEERFAFPMRIFEMRHYAITANDSVFTRKLQKLFLISPAHVYAAGRVAGEVKECAEVMRTHQASLLKTDLFGFIPLYDAMKYDNRDVIDYYRVKGIGPDYMYLASRVAIGSQRRFRSVLMMATLYKDRDIINAGLADVWKKTQFFQTKIKPSYVSPICIAIENHQLALLPYLYDPKVKAEDQMITDGRLEYPIYIVDYIISLALRFKIDMGKLREIVKAFKALGLDFHMSVYKDKCTILEHVFNTGAEPYTALDGTFFERRRQMADILITEGGVDVNQLVKVGAAHEGTLVHTLIKDIRGTHTVNTPELKKKRAYHIQILYYLLPKVNPLLTDSAGKTPMMLAMGIRDQDLSYVSPICIAIADHQHTLLPYLYDPKAKAEDQMIADGHAEHPIYIVDYIISLALRFKIDMDKLRETVKALKALGLDFHMSVHKDKCTILERVFYADAVADLERRCQIADILIDAGGVSVNQSVKEVGVPESTMVHALMEDFISIRTANTPELVRKREWYIKILSYLLPKIDLKVADGAGKSPMMLASANRHLDPLPFELLAAEAKRRVEALRLQKAAENVGALSSSHTSALILSSSSSASASSTKEEKKEKEENKHGKP